ncbi:MAG: hypothetical protein AUG81_08525 [Verrucomicrobia bacterium 13_1_20CM_4_54_11]|nr:MAG: hypothetical protein AUG81_08525 [Verrucomicrobia bacterium 13_1_20CM_4_54_11]
MTEARPVEVRFGEDAGPSRTGISSRRDAYAAPSRLHLWVLLVLILSLISTFTVDTAAASLKFGAVPFSPGSTVRANVPLSPQSDFKRQNRDDLADFYRRVGLSEGWVLLAGDGPQHAKNDNVAWRESMTMAAVDALHRSFPGSEKWPIACAGFSGGGKGVGYVAPFLAKNGCHVIGVYMTGANEDHLSDGYARLQPGPGFLNTPIYVSAGRDDRIATIEQQYNVGGSIKRTGFQRIRIGTFHGGHEVNDAQTSIALHWFRELAK